MTPAPTPAQLDVLERLGGRPRRQWPADTRDVLRRRIEEGVEPALAGLDELVVSKRALGSIHGCERRHVEEGDFAWTVATLTGTVVHKAIELSVFRREGPPPLELVDDALGLMEADTRGNVADFLRTLSAADRAELTSRATALVGRFVEGFPRLEPRWRPSVETRRRVELCSDRLVVLGRFDLTLGVADGSTARRVIVDLKTGRPAPTDRDDLRFYAVLETLVNGTPPAGVASFYLDSGRVDVEDVDDDVLEAATRRLVDGVRRLAELAGGAEPRERAGPACTWCPVQADCPTGTSYLADHDDPV